MHAHGPAPPHGGEGRPRLEVADVFRAHGEAYRQRQLLTRDQLNVMRDIETCRTAVLGGHVDVCDACGHSVPAYNSCRNRHCPKCQALTAAKWVAERMDRILPTHYFHGVFTLPAQLRPLCRRNPVRLYDLLFVAASQTLLQLGRDPERLGAQLGFTAVLHTWTRALEYHPHVHVIVTGGGLATAGDRWVTVDPGYLFPVQVQSMLFRGKFLDGLRRLYAAGDLDLGGKCGDWASPAGFQVLLDRLYALDWVVYAKRPFAGPEQVFKYFSNYTHRVGLSNRRLVSLDARGVCFRTKDGKTVTLAPEDFIRRFLLHVLPSGFVKIRHYGLMASSNAKTKLAAARRLLESTPPPPTSPTTAPEASAALTTSTILTQADGATTDVTSPTPSPSARAHSVGGASDPRVPQSTSSSGSDSHQDWRDLFKQLTGIDLTRCPRCQQGRMLRFPLPPPENTWPGSIGGPGVAMTGRPDTS